MQGERVEAVLIPPGDVSEDPVATCMVPNAKKVLLFQRERGNKNFESARTWSPRT